MCYIKYVMLYAYLDLYPMASEPNISLFVVSLHKL